MKKLIIAIVVCSLLVFASCSSAGKATTATTTPEQKMQSQLDDLSTQVFAFNTIVSQLKSQANTTDTSTTSAVNQDEIDALNETLTELNSTVETLQRQIKATQISLQDQIKTLQTSLQAASTSIGIMPVTLNGLSVSFLTNDIIMGPTGSVIPGTAQFAVKVVNTTTATISNLDITGTITGSNNFSSFMAANYPQLIDGAALCSYTYSTGGSSVVHFEAYGGSKTLSVPAGGSITIRPKLSILAVSPYQLSITTYNIALNAITYDISR